MQYSLQIYVTYRTFTPLELKNLFKLPISNYVHYSKQVPWTNSVWLVQLFGGNFLTTTILFKGLGDIIVKDVSTHSRI